MRLRLLLLPLLASAALLAGCTAAGPAATPTPTTNGVESKSADEILAAAKTAMEGAKSGHVTGDMTVATYSLKLDLSYVGKDNATGKVTFQGTDVQVVKVGDLVYVKPADTSIYKSIIPEQYQAMILPVLGSKWLKIGASTITQVIPVPLSPSDILSLTTPLTKGDVTTVNGQQAITIKDADGATLDVAITGQPYPLDIKAVAPAGSTTAASGNITFSDFDKDVTVTEPAAADTFDLSTILG